MKIGEEAVLTGLRYPGGPGEDGKPIEGRDFLVFVTPKIYPPEDREQAVNGKAGPGAGKKVGARRAAAEAPQTDLKALPAFGIPVPGKPVYFTSPFAPDACYVDIRGFPSGSEVQCPFTKRRFVVP
jgi:hypothetical protein